MAQLALDVRELGADLLHTGLELLPVLAGPARRGDDGLKHNYPQTTKGFSDCFAAQSVTDVTSYSWHPRTATQRMLVLILAALVAFRYKDCMPGQIETFTASRFTSGNFVFPTRIEVGPEHVLRIKPRLFGQTEESIAIDKVASVQISTGIFWSDIRIDSSGGTNPITSHGHRKDDAIRIRQLIELFQKGN